MTPPSSTLWGGIRKALGFGYDAVKSNNQRKPLAGVLRSEDAELPPGLRDRLVSGTRDITRNFSVAKWMVNRHLDYVTTFRFRSLFRNPESDRFFRRFVKNWSSRANCDIARRHPLRRLIRLAEARTVLDGDICLIKTPTAHLQAIEGDRIRTPPGGGLLPPGVNREMITHGILLDDFGAAESYLICNRPRTTDYGQLGTSFVFEKLVPANAIIHHGVFDRFDQVRGISALSAGLNEMRDTYSATKYALMKLKASQLLGINVYRDGTTPFKPPANPEDEGNETSYDNIPFGDELWFAQMEPGDRMEFLESKNPSTEFQNYQQVMISLTLKSLDIPYSFFNESFTTYSGQRQALLQYEQAADIKRQDVRDIYMEATKHAVEVAEAEGDLPRGLTAEDLMENCDWVSSGLPWIDPQKESVADDIALKNRTTSRQRIANRRGEDWFDIADELIQEDDYMEAGGLSPFSEANAERTDALLKGESDDDQDANPGTVGEEATRPVTG